MRALSLQLVTRHPRDHWRGAVALIIATASALLGDCRSLATARGRTVSRGGLSVNT